MRAIKYQSTTSKMLANRILHVIVSIGVWASLCPRYCYPLVLDKSAEAILAPMNTSVDPCEDFYGFACGSYAQNVSALFEPQQIIHDLMLTNISNFLAMNSSSSDPPILHKARTLYRSCVLNSSVARNQSLKSMADALQQVGLPVTPPLYEASDNFSYLFTMARSKAVFNMKFFVDPTIWEENSTHAFLFLSKPTDNIPLSFSNQPVPAFLTANHQTNMKHHENFLSYARRVTKIMYDYANKTVPDLFSSEFNSTFVNLRFLDMFLDYVTSTTSKKDFEARISNTRKTSMTFAVLTCQNKQIAPKDQFDWSKYIAILMEDKPGMQMTDYIKTYDSLYMNFIFSWVLCEMEPQERELYMWWKTVTGLAPYSTIFSYSEREPWCAEAVNYVFPHATALMLVNKCDMLQSMMKVRDMAAELRDVFNGTIANVTWMNRTEKDKLSSRLMGMEVCIGYPLWLNDVRKVNKFYEKYNEVNLVENDFLGNALKLVQLDVGITMKQATQLPTERCTFKSLDVNCYYTGYMNQLAIQAGYLQLPFYGHVHPALDFGSIGTALGHEMSHGFDSYRIETLHIFDENEAAQTEYSRRKQCFVDHYRRSYSTANATKKSSTLEDRLLRLPRYSNWTALFKDEALGDGRRTVDENLSDSNGLKIAFDAYKDYTKKYGLEPSPYGLEKYTPDQIFFIAYASKFCSRYSPSSFSGSMDVHSPHSIRVWGSLRNSEDFAKAWGCKKGCAWMNPNADKCETWQGQSPSK